jgi:hypothetical protein
MRSFCKFVTLVLALMGASVACALAPPALAAKLPSRRHYAHHGADIYGTRARYASPIYRCRSGRHYTYAGGWGCDYYVYAPDDLLRRR